MQFLDTNVLIYALDEPHISQKSVVARDIIDRSDWGLSVQVLQEFYTQATRLTRDDHLTDVSALSLVEHYARRPVQTLTPEIVRAAIATHQRYQISYWDAAIIEAARTLGCHTVLSEDLHSGQDFGGIRVVNPFTPSNH